MRPGRLLAAAVIFSFLNQASAQAQSASDIIKNLRAKTTSTVQFQYIALHPDGVAAYAQGRCLAYTTNPGVAQPGVPSRPSGLKGTADKGIIFFQRGLSELSDGTGGFTKSELFAERHPFDLSLYETPQVGTGDMGQLVLDGRGIAIRALQTTGVAGTPIDGPWVLYGTDGNGAAIAIRFNLVPIPR
jgi:hypothetical protein